MHERLRRILMNAHPTDGAPGGQPSTGTGAPAAPAQGASNAAEPSQAEQLKSLLTPMLADFRNGIFADLRKAGALGKGAKADDGQPAATTPQPASTADEVQSIVTRERAFNRAISSVQLTDAQFSRMERAFQLEKPEDPGAWVRDYVADLGVGKQSALGAQPPTNPAVNPATPPASAGGAPAPLPAASHQAEPWRHSKDDVAALIREHGMQKAGTMLRGQLRAALQGRRLSLK